MALIDTGSIGAHALAFYPLGGAGFLAELTATDVITASENAVPHRILGVIASAHSATNHAALLSQRLSLNAADMAVFSETAHVNGLMTIRASDQSSTQAIAALSMRMSLAGTDIIVFGHAAFAQRRRTMSATAIASFQTSANLTHQSLIDAKFWRVTTSPRAAREYLVHAEQRTSVPRADVDPPVLYQERVS